MATGIVTAGGGHAWETGVVAEVGRSDASLTVVRRCADIADVLAVASTGQISAAIVAADLRRLDSESVHELAACGVRVVGIYRAGDERVPSQLQRIGVADAVPDDATPAAIVQVLRDVLSSREDVADESGKAAIGSDPMRALSESQTVPRFAPRSRSDVTTDATPDVAPADGPHRRRGGRRRTHDAREERPAHAVRLGRGQRIGPSAPSAASRDVDTSRSGRVIAVWGPAGAPGRSTVAMGIADRMVAGGSSVVLIDADVYGGVLANAFGLLDESAGLAGACRLASNGRLGPSDFAALSWQVADRLTLMTGIARADRWPELRPSTIPHVLDCARVLADVVIVDCAAVLETDEEITFDTLAPRRNGATIAVLDAAEVVIAVGSADPPGMERLARGYADVTQTIAGVEPRIVFNRVRATAASTSELGDASRRFCGCDPVAFLPEDRALVDLAWQRGVTLSTVASKAPLISAFDDLAQTLSVASSR
ncbi:MAG: chromosome partitioning protein [Nakamurella sp.]